MKTAQSVVSEALKRKLLYHEDGMEIFFAPDDEIPEEVKKNNPAILSNYEAAVNIAKIKYRHENRAGKND